MKANSWKDLADICLYEFPNPLKALKGTGDLISIGADLDPETLIFAYAHGLFPMHIQLEESAEKSIGWFCPESRAIIPIDNLRVTRSMKKSYKKYECRIDTCFEKMMRMCMSVPRHSGWIDEEFVQAYTKLYELGFAHSVEVFSEDELVGGLYGVSFGGFFAGESMVHTSRDASKVALMHLVQKLKQINVQLLDAQWLTPHLASLGAREVTREHYFDLLGESLSQNAMSW